MKLLFTFCLTSAVLIMSKVTDVGDKISSYFSASKQVQNFQYYDAAAGTNAAHVDSLVIAAEAFKALLSSSQQASLQQTFTTALAQNWSNLPCGSQCRNGVEFTTLSTVQLAAALNVIKIAGGTVTNEGYDEFMQIRTADSILHVNATAQNANAYGDSLYFISFLNEPSTTTGWMLQYGGHHYAENIAINGGIVTGATPLFEGVEPKSYVAANGNTYTPITQEHDAMAAMLASLTTTELDSAQLSETFTDVLLGPGEDGNFPATKEGIKVSTLSSATKSLIVDAMLKWVSDVNDITRDSLISIYTAELDSTYIAYSTDATLSTSTAYARIDGPSVWIEFVCQNGVVFQNQIHYHTIWRDHTRDYGDYLASGVLPLTLTSFTGKVLGNGRVLSWSTANETNVDYFNLQRSTDSKIFSTITKVNAANKASNQYSYIDNESINNTGSYYYRLSVVDKDGKVSYSNIVPLTINGIVQSLSLYPNPSRDKINITLTKSISNATIKVNSISGKEVLTNTGVTGSNIVLNVSQLPAGLYFIRINDNGIITTAKFIKAAQ